MLRPLALYIGLRYTRAKRRNHFISFISLTSMLGMALGITALITVLSVMNGFQHEVRERILSLTPHATVSSWDGRLEDWQAVLDRIDEHPEVLAGAPYVRGEVMLNRGGQVSGALLQGILPERERQVSAIAERIPAGDLDALQAGGFGIILGEQLAALLGVSLGDRVTVVTPQANTTPLGTVPVLKRFEVVGVFASGMYDFDRGLALIHVEDGARLFRLGEAVSGLRLKLDDLFGAPRIARELAGRLADRYRVSDWTREHASYFRAVQIEKTAMFIILMLIVAVAAFNIVSTLVMVVTDKRADIAILRTLGASPRTVMGIFMVQGVTIGLIGTLLGLAGGISLALNVDTVVAFIERSFGIRFLAPDLYLISDLPSQVLPGDVVTIALSAFILATLATLYPAWRAARTQPAEALRYE
ncbi:MAG: lipoprotein-releasing ABC transporter permease subunit [Candidatus Competibacterales bacterium]|nr:lipoprotein-releasing ABC transporter permease subunit [Candidatus Competibacterales bacterium]